MKFLLVAPAVRTASVFLPLMLSAALSCVQAGPELAVKPISAEERSSLTFSRGNIESVLAARAGNYFSTTQKVNGYTAELAAEAYAMGKLLTGEDYEDKEKTYLDIKKVRPSFLSISLILICCRPLVLSSVVGHSGET